MPSADAAQSKPAMFFVLIGINGLLALSFIGMMVLFYGSKGDEIISATDSGRRLSIAIKDNAITGAMHSLKAENQATTTPDAPATAEPSVTKMDGFDVGDESDTTAPSNIVAGAESEANVASLVANEEEAVESIRVNPRTAASLPEAPIDGLSEASEYGALPSQSLTSSPLKAYARPFAASSPAKPLVAIVMMDLGTQNTLTDNIISLAPDLTLSLSPYSKDAALWSQSARNMGHEVWLMLPVQPEAFPANDPGPLGILGSLKDPENEIRLKKVMASFTGYSGMIIPPHEALSKTPEKLELIAKQTKERGLGLLAASVSEQGHSADFLNSRTNHRLVADIMLDAQLDPVSIGKQFKELESIALKKGFAIGVMRPYPVSVASFQSWVATAPQPVQLAPLSAIYLEDAQ